MNTHENDSSLRGSAPLELEIQLAGSAVAIDFQQALAAVDTTQLNTITLILNNLAEQQVWLRTLLAALPQWPAVRALNVRWIAAVSVDAIAVLIDLQHACQRQNVSCRIDFLLPHDADGFAALANPTSVLQPVQAASRWLRQQHIEVRWLIPLSSALVFRLEALYLLARDEAVQPLLVLPELVLPELVLPELVSATAPALSANEKLFIHDFIQYRLLETDLALLTPAHAAYYRSLQAFLDGDGDGYGAAEFNVIVLNYAEASGWQCRVHTVNGAGMRAAVLGAETVVQTSRLAPLRAQLQDVAQVLFDGVRAYLRRALLWKKPLPALNGSERFNKVLLIGAYGGEHIGDVAILGGVLRRIHARFGTTEAVLMTQRPRHTRHLTPMLDVPVAVTVEEYQHAQIRRHLEAVDCVVFAGGPLIDIPKQLVRHLYTVSLARKMGKPFIFEGIGPGPFARLPSLYTARQLVLLASRISLRTSDCAQHELLKGVEFEVGQCPAFDYLDARGPELTRMPATELDDIAALLEGTEGRPVIGVNLRPIGHLYTAGSPEDDVAAYTKRIEQRFEHRFAEGLRQFDQQSSIKPVFIFFPMNAIQFGCSDILSAYRIQRILGPEIDFRVWQADASLDGVVALLRRLDVAITMRFHATIFALTQQCKVIGIDYRIGKRDKVADLLDDVGQLHNCARIDLLTDEWLVERLTELTKA